MKRLARTCATTLLALMLGHLLPRDIEAAARCSNATLRGTYGFQGEGFVIFGPSALASAAVGWATFDGRGSFSGAQTFSVNGQIFRWIPFEGQYQVNRDCTGSATHGMNTLQFVVVDRGDDVRFLNTDQGNVLSLTFRKQQTANCGLADAEGSFGYTARGRILGPTGGLLALAAVGRVTYDSEGHGVGGETFSLHGTILQRTYEVTLEQIFPNCTGSGIVEDSLGQRGSFDFVMVDRTREALLIQTDPGTVLILHGARQSGGR